MVRLIPWAAGSSAGTPSSDQPQPKLPVPLMALDKILDRGRHVADLQVASAPQLVSNVLGDVFRPSFRGVECNDADGIAVLTLKEANDGCLKICVFAIRFHKCPAGAAEIVLNNVHRLIGPTRDDGRRPSGRTHTDTPQITISTEDSS